MVKSTEVDQYFKLITQVRKRNFLSKLTKTIKVAIELFCLNDIQTSRNRLKWRWIPKSNKICQHLFDRFKFAVVIGS
jgi:hypothetical protein